MSVSQQQLQFLHRETDRQTDRQTHRQTDRQTDRQNDLAVTVSIAEMQVITRLNDKELRGERGDL